MLIKFNNYFFRFIFLTFGTMSMIRHTIDGYIMAYIVFVFLFYGGSYYWYVI